MAAKHQNAIVALPGDIGPQALAQSMQPFPFLSQLALNPTLQRRAVRPTAEQQRLFGGQFSGRGELRSPPFRHALPALSFPAEMPRLPEQLSLQCLGQILLFHPMLGVGMGVAIALPIAEGGPIPIGIAQMAGDVLLVGGTDGFEGIEKAQHAVALLRSRQVKGCLRQRVQALGQAHPLEGCGTGFDHHNRLRVRQAHVLSSGDQHPPEDEAGVFPGFHHPRQPEQGGVRIGSPQGFDESADGVVVGITMLVVEHGPLLDGFLRDRQADADVAVGIGVRAFHRQLERIQQAAGIAVGHIDEMLRGFGFDHHGPCAVAAFHIAQSPLQQLVQILRLQRQQPEQPGTADQGLVDFEVGILRGGPDQGDGAVLHPGEQCILLRTVEAMDFIDEQDRSQPVTLQPLPGGIHLEPQLFHAGQHGVEAAEVGARVAGNDPGQGGFADAGRAMQDQVADAVGLDGAA